MMLDTIMPLTGGDDMKTSKPKHDSITDSKELLNALKRECLERKALTRVERLQNTDALRNGSSIIVKPNQRHQTIKEEKPTPSPPATPPTENTVADKDYERLPAESATDNDSKTPTDATNNSANQGRVFFLSENYENVSGDESNNARSLESTNGVSHEMIERFLPLVDAMEQVVPSDTEDMLDEGGLIIDDAEASSKQALHSIDKRPEIVKDSPPATESREDPTEQRESRTEVQCLATQMSKKQTSGPKAKRARISKVRKSTSVLEKLRSAGKKGKVGAHQRSGAEKPLANCQKKEKGSGSEMPSDEDSSTTTVDGTEYPSSSDEETKASVPEPEDAATPRQGTKRLVRTAEELRKSIVKDPLNEESRYNRLVQELPGFNWLEQKIMGHNSAPVKAPVTAPPPPLNGKEKYSDGDAKSTSSSIDILSRSMSEIQGDGVFAENNEEETVIKCASTQTDHSRNTPTPGGPDRPPSLKMDFKSRPPFTVTSPHSPTALSPPGHPRLLRVADGPPLESEKPWHPLQSPGAASGLEKQKGQNVHSPSTNDADVMYIGEVDKTARNDNRSYPPTEIHPQAPRPQQLQPRPSEVLSHVAALEAQQKAAFEAHRQFYPWSYRPDAGGPPPLSPTVVPQNTLHGVPDVNQHGPIVHSAVAMPERLYGPPYVQMAQKAFRAAPLVPPGEVPPRLNNMPMYSYFGFPRLFMPPYPRPTVQHPSDVHVSSDGSSAPHYKNAVDLQTPKASELQKELQKIPRGNKMAQSNVSHPTRPSVAVAPQNHPQPPPHDQRTIAAPQGLYPVPRRPQPDRAKPIRSPPAEHCMSPTKRTGSAELPPLAIVHTQPALTQEPARISPAVPERRTPEKNDNTQSTEQELLKRKDELKYLDHLASQKEAEYERLVQMRTEKLRILTELENRIKATNEQTEKQQAQKSPTAVVPLRPYHHLQQGTRAYKEARQDSEVHAQRPRPKYDNEVPAAKVPPQSIPSLTPPRSTSGSQYPIHSSPTAAIPVLPTTNIPITVPLIGRGLFNVRSIDIPREIPQVILHENTAPVAAETRPYYPSDYNRHSSPTVAQNPQVKRTHSATDLQKQQEESRRMPAPPQPHPTVQRPYPQRVNKPPPLQPETRTTSWPFKEGYRPDLAAYYGQQTYPFRGHYAGGKATEQLPYPSVQQYGVTVPHAQNSASHPSASYPAAWRDYAATMRGKFVQPAQEQKERNTDPNAHRTIAMDMKSYRSPSDAERALYEQELARDAARMASNAFTREGSYGADHSRNQGHVNQGHVNQGHVNQGHVAPHPQKPQPGREEPSKCALCGKYAQYLCSGCQSVWYCGQQCQKSNWNNHSTNCHNIKRLAEKHQENQQRVHQWSMKPDHETDVHKVGRNEAR